MQPPAQESVAVSRRFEYARSATLYAILAAEAYANQCLQWHLSRKELEAADKLPTFDKYLLGPRSVHGSSLLERAGTGADAVGSAQAQGAPRAFQAPKRRANATGCGHAR
jgi:hypothetical protein